MAHAGHEVLISVAICLGLGCAALIVLLIFAGLVGLFDFITGKVRRPRYIARIRHEAWRTEQASARVFAAGHRRMMDAAFRYTWSKWNGGGW